MNRNLLSQNLFKKPSFAAFIGIAWAIAMLVATLTLDKPSNVIPFWLLLIAFYIVRWQKSLS